MKKEAEQSSIDTFGENLRSLLLQPPCFGEVILGVDPGFTNGCKMAAVSKTGACPQTVSLLLTNRSNTALILLYWYAIHIHSSLWNSLCEIFSSRPH